MDILTEIEIVFKEQSKNRWFVANSTFEDRIFKLKKLKKNILNTENELKTAILNDFSKPHFETEITEIFVVLEEINYVVKNLKKWMKLKLNSTPPVLIGARSYIKYEAKGQVLIIAPWNYPFMLLIGPLVDAIAAGNCVICKPSEKTPQTSIYLQKLIDMTFPKNEIALFQGNQAVAEKLINLPFDHFFFTGSTAIGKKVLSAASQYLATTTLELGGKSPVIIGNSARLEDAAQKICWGKFLNASQTCVSPDYILIANDRADEFLELMEKNIKLMYGETIEKRKQSKDYARLIDKNSFVRLCDVLSKTLENGAHLYFGGNQDLNQFYIEPTLLDHVQFSYPIMQEEIFGPILPIIRYNQLDTLISEIQNKNKPLALYIFSKNQNEIERIIQSTSAGSTVVNHVNIQFGNSSTPLGGVGTSGMGRHHGFYGFRELSNERTIIYQSRFGFTNWLFPPYSGLRFKISQLMTRFLSRH